MRSYQCLIGVRVRGPCVNVRPSSVGVVFLRCYSSCSMLERFTYYLLQYELVSHDCSSQKIKCCADISFVLHLPRSQALVIYKKANDRVLFHLAMFVTRILLSCRHQSQARIFRSCRLPAASANVRRPLANSSGYSRRSATPLRGMSYRDVSLVCGCGCG